ncbi:ribokinase [Microvirga rosea]|uniref:ribokinase n=1 Tax=Microvirga rosea TaxID=2715425 RepID=UPI001D09D4B9|nr:ribokinase [Microvirga rosea]MCB8819690.1 ribokinase [Microvirga rosea]
MTADTTILVFGSINMDLVARVETIARPGETVLSPKAESFFGGKGANQAVAAARVAKGTTIDVLMAGAVGNDPFGQSCLDNLARNGVATHLVAVLPEPTGCAFITVDRKGENAITVASGTNMALHAAELTEHAVSPVVLVLQMEVSLEQNLIAARWAKSLGAQIVWNLAPAPTDDQARRIDEIMSVTDVLIVNEHEALVVSGGAGKTGTYGHEDAASFLARTFRLTCVVTAGASGATAFLQDGERIHADAPRIEPLDTTGAGDTFVGVLAAGIAERLPIKAAMERACLAASRTCMALGAQGGMPWREEI